LSEALFGGLFKTERKRKKKDTKTNLKLNQKKKKKKKKKKKDKHLIKEENMAIKTTNRGIFLK